MKILCSWSGGIDSTALIAKLLQAGHHVHAVSMRIYGGKFALRESFARRRLLPFLTEMGHLTTQDVSADWIWAFSPDGFEIPRRNRYIIDHMIAKWPSFKNIGLGEYIGADTWVIQDHVGAADADARALAAYVYQEYGLSHRLWTLSDFGEARYKHHRLMMGLDAGVPMDHTTNCLSDESEVRHCGRCYKCVERSVAFALVGRIDNTDYLRSPMQSEAWEIYHAQMQGMPYPKPILPAVPMPMPIESVSYPDKLER